MDQRKVGAACDICHRRKIKCDIGTTGTPCSKCKELKVESQCVLHKRRKKTDGMTYFVTQDKFLNVIKFSPKKYMRSAAQTESRAVNMAYYPAVNELASKFYKNVVGYETELDDLDLQYMTQLGCFNLPDKVTCWKLFNYFFKNMNKCLLILDYGRFIRDHQKLDEVPSLVLVQALLCVGSILAKADLATEHERDTYDKYTAVFYKRTKALVEASVEQDPIALVQTYMVLSCISEMTKYAMGTSGRTWLRMAHQVAQDNRFYQEQPRLPQYKRNMYRRLWWIIYARDRMFVFWHGGSCLVSKSETAISKDSQDLFALDEFEHESHDYFRSLIKIGELIDITSSNDNSADGILLWKDVDQCDALVTKWFESLPAHLVFRLDDPGSQTGHSVLITMYYYLLLLTIHRVNLLREYKKLAAHRRDKESLQSVPSWGLTFHCAFMISQISGRWLKDNNYAPCPNIYMQCVFSSSFTMLCQLLNKDATIAKMADECIQLNLLSMQEYGKQYLQGQMAHYVVSQVYHDKKKRLKLLRSSFEVSDASDTFPDRLNDEISARIEHKLEARSFEGADDQLEKDRRELKNFLPFQLYQKNYAPFIPRKLAKYSTDDGTRPVVDPATNSLQHFPETQPSVGSESVSDSSQDSVSEWLAHISNPTEMANVRDSDFVKHFTFSADPTAETNMPFELDGMPRMQDFADVMHMPVPGLVDGNYMGGAATVPDFDQLLKGL
ncbi:hypothetical protein KL928_005119 [Ogataea angusta]|uniref:Zn(2)-C6 fungal-type domain-containing protein n=1 Tax=Pichia angusta TaxID=870730 RepID=A0AAN6DCD1_PICAN|nr:uncharacterized protein KL928_005119 [Ogataea angusta]KAG7816153.1 hypothetical protein KL928_005119 [Ogataea angusta]